MIGFSGDDPNFLEWIGWIRDELGHHHAPIYLVGALSLSNVDRLLLARRGVTPIDLSPLFPERAFSDSIQSSALEWFLECLKATKRLRPESWPTFETGASEKDEYDPPILTGRDEEPEYVSSLPASGRSTDEATVIKLLKRWRWERDIYPGWLVPTDGKRTLLWYRTNAFLTPLFKFAEKWPPKERLLLFREINWRLETAMVPLFSNFIPPLESVLHKMLPTVRDGVHQETSIEAMKSLSISDREVVEAWHEIAFSLLREAREDYNPVRWNKIRETISEVIVLFPRYIDKFYYEQALWAIWNVERIQARELLLEWSPSTNSPLAMMWKAGLLAELDELGESRLLLRTALREVRKSLHNAGQDIALLSLEGWCTYLLSAVETADDFSRVYEIRAEFSHRLQELRSLDCDPRLLIEYLDNVLSGKPPVRQKHKKVEHGFDPGHRRVSYSILGGNYTRWLPAFACIRLFEQVGMPMRLPHVNVTGNALRNSCIWVAPFIEFWSPAILIRAGKVNDLTKHGFVDRTQVAGMEPERTERLYRWAIEALKRELPSQGGTIENHSTQATLLETLIEVLSRLTLNLEVSDIREAFSLAIRFHKHPGFSSHMNLNKSCGIWFKRLFLAADDKLLLEWMPQLIYFPLSNESSQSIDTQLIPWPDPMTEFPSGLVRAKVEDLTEFLDEIEKAIEWLLKRVESESGNARQRALMRLILASKFMTPEQRQKLGNLLWEKIPENRLPEITSLYSFEFLHLSAPENIEVASRVKEHILSLDPRNLVSTDRDSNSQSLDISLELEDRMILESSLATKPVVQLPDEPIGEIEWSLDETKRLREKAIDLWENERVALVQDRPELQFGVDRIVNRLERVGMFLRRVVLPNMEAADEEEWKLILDLLSETRKHKVYPTAALPYVLLHRPSESEDVAQRVIEDLSSEDESAVAASAEAVRHWIHLADANLLEEPPTETIGYLIERVIFRQPVGIYACLEQLTYLLSEIPDAFSPEQVNLIVSSLIPWHLATCLPLPEESMGFPEKERPELRVLLGRLASALNDLLKNSFPGRPEPAAIASLRELLCSDPLPEVRRSFNST